MKLPKFWLLAGIALALPAAAQTTADSAAAEEIIVTGRYTIRDRIDTATGLGLTVRETPQSVSIITEQRILDQNLQTVADVVTNAVGVAVNEIDDVRNTFSARGFEIRNYQVDGVPLAWTLAGGAGETIADVSLYERIEIVRGATGLLTGAGDPSASINLVRKHADSRDWRGYVNGSIGSWETWRLLADVGGAVTADGRIRVRGVVKYEEGESFTDLYSNRKLVLYGTVDADLTDNTLLRAGISYQEGAPDAPLWGALPSFDSDGGFIAWPRSKTSSASWSYWDTENENIYATLRHEFGNGWTIQANYNRLRNAQQTQILYLSGLVDGETGAVQFSFPYSDEGKSIQNSYDAQLKGGFGLFGRSHDFVLGALHSVQNRDNTTFAALSFPPVDDYVNWDGAAYPNPGFSEAGTLAVDERVEQTGYYGALRLDITDRLKLIGGGRLADYRVSGFNFGPPRSYGDDNEFIPYAGALFDLTASHRLYASYTEIFQPQNAQDRNLEYLPPLDGKAYEIGLKSAFFDEALQTSIALFRIEQDNLAQPDIVITPPGGGLPLQTFVAARGTTSEGFELEVTGQPAPGWNVNFGYSQFKAEDAGGEPVSTDQPRRLLKLFTTYRLLGLVDGLVLGGGVNYRSRNYSDGLNPATGAPFRFQQNGYALVSLLARYEVSDALQVQANVDNLFDKSFYSQVGFFQQYRYGTPRNFTLGATYRF